MNDRGKGPEGPNMDRWLLTYADLITLLLALFVIMYSMSRIDSVKYTKVMSAFGGVFGKPPSQKGEKGQSEVKEAAPVESERTRISNRLTGAIESAGAQRLVFISQTERGVIIHMMEELLFASGKADLKSSSLKTLDILADVLRELPNDIRVEGHTDNIPIGTTEFPSNWHLSVRRAVNTAYYLIQKHGLNPQRLVVIGYAEYRPLTPNQTEDERGRNRRVDILITTGD
jgi:chemotaxis protein MotB